ncbi:unnamed protein product [Symbiodinium sp. CCMP2592]|nr:unnamed protein product [Symbiodinium sp. CCMP2592]
MGFASWLDDFCPPDPEKTYAIDMDAPAVVRPWMLAFRSDYSTSGFIDPEVLERLLELIVSEGFLSNPDLVGCEKLSCTYPPDEYLDEPRRELPALQPGSALLRPFSIAYIKGWKRAVSLLILLAGVRELGLEDQIPHHVRASQAALQLSCAADSSRAGVKIYLQL